MAAATRRVGCRVLVMVISGMYLSFGHYFLDTFEGFESGRGKGCLVEGFLN